LLPRDEIWDYLIGRFSNLEATMKKGLLITIGSALATAAILKAAPALAEPVPQNVAIVHTTDLDLTSATGRVELDHRLVNAAYEVCGTASDADLAAKNAVRACRAAVLAKARTQSQQLASRGTTVIEVAARR